MADAGIPTTRSTRRTIRRRIGELTGWEVWNGLGGKATTSGSTTTLLDADLYSSALDQKVRRRDYFLMLDSATSGADSGKWRYITQTVDSSGTITWDRALAGATADNDEYEIWAGEGPDPDVIHQCIDRALQDACWYWRMTPLTMAPGGDVGDELLVDSDNIYEFSTAARRWLKMNCTTTLPELDPPDEFGRRVIRILATASPGYVELGDTSQVGINVDVDNRANWRIEALVSAKATLTGSAGGAASIILYDATNSATITPGTPLTWTRRGWGLISSDFTIPAGCNSLAIRLQADTNTQYAEFAWVQLWQKDQTRFSLPRRITSKRRIGPVYERVGDYYGEFRRRPWSGSVERREMQGRGVSLHLQPAPGNRPLWYYEKVSFPKLTSSYTGGEGGGATLGLDDDNTTWCPLEWVTQAALVECYKYLQRRDGRE